MNRKTSELDNQNNMNFLYSNIFIYQPNDYFNQDEYLNNSDNYNDDNIYYVNEEKTKEKTKGEDLNKNEQKKNIDSNKNVDSNKNDNLNLPDLINDNLPSMNLSEIIEKNKNEQKKCGRKRTRTSEKSAHTKYSDDNIRRKCKHLVLKSLLEFINEKIYKMYNGNIGNGIFRKELQTMNQSQKSDATINFNQNFIQKKIGDIFGEKISGRFTNYSENHNKILIEKLMNEKDEDKKEYFNKLFNLNFLQCLRHFIGVCTIDELEGLKSFDQIKNELLIRYPNDGMEYIEHLDYYLKNFEEIIYKKKARKPRK